MPKATVSGTDADLRKLSLDGARSILLSYGIPDNEIEKLGRWERIGLVRKLSSDAKAAGEGGSTKFARGSRYSLQQQQLQYREQAQLIFDNQVRALSEPNPDISDDEDEANELDDFGTALETMLQPKKRKQRDMTIHQKKVVQEEEDEAERKEFEKFLEEEIKEKKEEPKNRSSTRTTTKSREKNRNVYST